MSIKVRLAILGKRQTDVLKELRKRGFETLAYNYFNECLNGMRPTPGSKKVLEACEEVLAEWEREAPEAAGE